MRIHRRIIATLATLMLVVGGLLVPAIPASAALGTVLVNSAASLTATPGTTITISGTGFTTNTPATIVANPGAVTLATGITVAAGAFSTSVAVPALARGAYTITATNTGDTTGTAATLTVAPVVTVSPTSGVPGTTVTVTGSGFTANATLGVLNLNNASSVVVQAIATSIIMSATGTFSQNFLIPFQPRGAYTVVLASDNAVPSDTASATLSITYTPSITLSDSTATSGQTISVNGTGFGASDTNVRIFVDSTQAFTTTSNSTGAIFATFALPAGLTAGFHSIYGVDTQSNQSSTALTINIVAKATLSTTTVAVGSAVTVSGTAFSTSTPVKFYLDGTLISGATATTDTNGAFSNVSVTIPATSGGTHTFKVQDDAGNFDSSTLTVTSKSSITPVTGPAGTSVNITGSGFIANTTITVKYNGVAVTTVPAAITSDNTGTVTGSFKTPAGPSAAYSVTISDGTNTNTATFTSVATATISPTKGNTGTSVQITGAGYKASATVTITYNNSNAGTATSDTSGNFTANLNIPSAPTGDHTMTISDGTNSISQNFSITPSATMDPIAGFVGTGVTVKGTGFTALRAISVKYDQTEAISPPPTTDANGSFTVAIKVPASKGGSHVVVVSDGVNTQNFTFTMDATAPSAPAPQLPLTNSQAESLPSLKWSDITDQSAPVTYNLQVSDDAAFAHLIVDKTGLTVSSFTMPTELPNRSKQAPYYWRVQAVDAASNASPWSNANTFFIGFVLQSWALYTIFGFVVIVIGVLGFWLGKRRAMSM